MADVKSTTVVPIASYCFLLAVFSFSLAINAYLTMSNLPASEDIMVWVPIVAYGIFALGLAAVGIGILQENNLCWRILFFSLAICVASIASLFLVFIIFLFIDINTAISTFQVDKVSPVKWFSFLFFFLSEIIVLYYLTTEEVVAIFGGIGDLIAPF